MLVTISHSMYQSIFEVINQLENNDRNHCGDILLSSRLTSETSKQAIARDRNPKVLPTVTEDVQGSFIVFPSRALIPSSPFLPFSSMNTLAKIRISPAFFQAWQFSTNKPNLRQRYADNEHICPIELLADIPAI